MGALSRCGWSANFGSERAGVLTPSTKEAMEKRIGSFVLALSMLCACINQQRPILADNIRLYEHTGAWKLAQAVDDQDTSSIAALCAKDSSLVHFQEQRFGQTLLQWAVYTDKYESAKALCEAGANPNVQSNNGTSAFIHAAGKYETSDYLKLLLRYGGDVNAVAMPKDGNSPQMDRTPLIAAAYYNFESVKLLVEAGADVNYYNNEHEQCALLAACDFQRIEIVQYLIQAGADFRRPLYVTLEGDTMYLHDELRHMIFDLTSEQYKKKMAVVEFLKARGMDYRKTEVPPYYYENYSKEFLDKY